MPTKPFDSASALREANRLLVERLHTFGDDDFPGSFLDEVESFQRQAAATGAYLSALDDRSEAQSLINFWLTILFNGGRRPDSVILDPFDSEAARARAGGSAPYKGLDAFQIEDCNAFFGRGDAVRQMLDRLATHRLLAVTGLSGSGKSSVVRAGLIPRLREGELTGSRDWQVADPIVPGRDPVGALSELAARCGGSPGRMAAPEELVAALDSGGVPALISVDQFEELFTLCDSEEDRRFVLDALTLAAAGGAHRHIVIVTMRSEFDSRVETHPEFAALFAAGRIQIGALSAHELRTAIEEPATQVGVAFEPGLPEELVQRVLGEPAGLPLLQFTLLQLWQQRSSDNKLTWEAYTSLGGSPREILARRANEVYESFATNQDRIFSQRIFLALAEIGGGLEPTARRVTRVELDRIGSRDSVDHVLRVWQENGLIRISPPPAPGEPIAPESQVEVAHEALIRNWERLVGWIEDHFAATRRRRLLTERARAWREGKDTFLGELSLREAEQYGELSEEEQSYVEASRRAVDAYNASLQRRKRWALAAGIAGVILLGGGVTAAGYAVQASEAVDRAERDQRGQAMQFAREQRLQLQDFRRTLQFAQRRLQDASLAERDARRVADRAAATARLAEERLRQARQQERATLATLRRAQMSLLQTETVALMARGDLEQQLEQIAAARERQAIIAAEERPAIVMEDFARGEQLPDSWISLLPTRDGISESATAVGRLRMLRDGNEAFATAFIIADGIAATLLSREGGDDVSGWTLSFENEPEALPGLAFPVQSLAGQMPVGGDGDPQLRILLLAMAERNSLGRPLPPPLQLAEVTRRPYEGSHRLPRRELPNVGVFVPDPGNQVYLVGFPGRPADDPIARRVLGNVGVVKRLQPGFLLGAGGGEVNFMRLRYNASTFPENTGSPVFNRATCEVVGIHWGGVAAGDSSGSRNFGLAFDEWLLIREPLRGLLPPRPPAGTNSARQRRLRGPCEPVAQPIAEGAP